MVELLSSCYDHWIEFGILFRFEYLEITSIRLTAEDGVQYQILDHSKPGLDHKTMILWSNDELDEHVLTCHMISYPHSKDGRFLGFERELEFSHDDGNRTREGYTLYLGEKYVESYQVEVPSCEEQLRNFKKQRKEYTAVFRLFGKKIGFKRILENKILKQIVLTDEQLEHAKHGEVRCLRDVPGLQDVIDGVFPGIDIGGEYPEKRWDQRTYPCGLFAVHGRTIEEIVEKLKKEYEVRGYLVCLPDFIKGLADIQRRICKNPLSKAVPVYEPNGPCYEEKDWQALVANLYETCGVDVSAVAWRLYHKVLDGEHGYVAARDYLKEINPGKQRIVILLMKEAQEYRFRTYDFIKEYDVEWFRALIVELGQQLGRVNEPMNAPLCVKFESYAKFAPRAYGERSPKMLYDLAIPCLEGKEAWDQALLSQRLVDRVVALDCEYCL